MTALLLRYVAGFFFLTTIALAGFAIYRGEVISGLQSQLIENKSQQIKVIIDSTEMADKIGQQVQNGINSIQVSKEKTTHEVERIIKEPIYLNTCFDSSGLSVLNQAISTPVANEPSESVSASKTP